MKDEDYIRKAVELADSFYESAGMFTEDSICDWWSFDDVPQVILDALNAQLVRQVQNAGYQIIINHHWSNEVFVSIYNTTNGGDYCEHFRRTTIYKAIVDSKVLEND